MRARPRRRPGRWLLALILIGLPAYVGVTFVQVWLHAASPPAPADADAIIVLGAAQYDGVPSPVLAARLDHAADLYAAGVAPTVVVTGANRPGDRFSEASAAATYLHHRGVPEAALVREVTGRNTWESLAASARVLRAQTPGPHVVLVSDPLHALRLEAISDEVGLAAQVSPTPSSRITGPARYQMAAREAVAVATGRATGFRRLTNLQAALGD